MNKQKRTEKLKDFYLDELSLDEVIETCNQVKATYENSYSRLWVDVRLYYDCGNPSYSITFKGTREETNEEATARVVAEKECQKNFLASQRIEFERLKKIFEGVDV